MDLNFVASPRNKLIALLQKEQDEAMTLLDANPFVTSLLIKYSEGGAVKPSSPENEELIALRATNNAIRQDYERLRADYETVNQQKKAANMISEGLEMKLASTVEEKKKLLEENEALKASLKESQTEVVAGLDLILEMKNSHASSLKELRRENEDNKAKAAVEVLTVQMDLEKMKAQFDYLWQTISERNSQSPQPVGAFDDAPSVPVKVDIVPCVKDPLPTIGISSYWPPPPSQGVPDMVEFDRRKTPVIRQESDDVRGSKLGKKKKNGVVARSVAMQCSEAKPEPTTELNYPAEEKIQANWPEPEPTKEKIQASWPEPEPTKEKTPTWFTLG